MPSGLQPRVNYLNNGGFRVLHDLCILLKPSADLTIDEEGELYIASTTVVPRLIAAEEHMSSIIDKTLKGNWSNMQIIDTRTLSTCKEVMNDLWKVYLAEYLHDELFLCATLLDPRNWCGRTCQRLSKH